MTKTQKWLSSTMNGIESENARLIQTVLMNNSEIRRK